MSKKSCYWFTVRHGIFDGGNLYPAEEVNFYLDDNVFDVKYYYCTYLLLLYLWLDSGEKIFLCEQFFSTLKT